MQQACIDRIYKSRQLTPKIICSFQTEIYTYYQNHKRKYPWRETKDPYHILVSEIMLQQTQTNRSVDKYKQFIEIFPDFKTLAKAPLHDILTQWHGLGYNRRALQLKQLSEIVLTTYQGKLPSTIPELQTLPGIGPYTAAAICAFAFNQPTVLIETNIRSVMLYFFCLGKSQVKDSELIELIEKTLDTKNPREWYYALMDYGAMLKKKYKHINKQSAHYQKQSSFQGSNRQIRGMIIKILLSQSEVSLSELSKLLHINSNKIEKIITQMEKETILSKKNDKIMIK